MGRCTPQSRNALLATWQLAALLLAVAMHDLAGAQLAALPQRVTRTVPQVFGPPEAEPAKLPMAADGYCVVSLHDRQQWVTGNMSTSVLFDGRQYAFASRRERDIFAAAPIAYAPVLSGDCPVTFAETGQRVAGKVQFGVVQAGRLYFFADEAARVRFVADPARFESADIADGGKCLVSRVEYRRDVAGLPETAVLTGGLRRLFAGAYEQRLYLQQPARYDAASASQGVPSATSATDPNARGGWRPSAPGSGAPNATRPSDAAAEGGEQADGASDSEKAGEESAESDLAAGAEPVMGGYCPVMQRDKNAWVRGRYDHHVKIDGLLFLTAGAAEREALLADPAKYIPALGGDCPVSLVDYGQRESGSTFHAAHYQQRLYLFADAERKAAFAAQPKRYANIDLAASGACIVTLRDLGKNTPGLAEYAAWYNGLLYQFLGPDEKAKFLAAPEKYAEQ
jgi:YHS domain-containing protein